MVNFLKYQLFYFILSSFVIGVGVYYILTQGFIYSIDFVGGGLVEFVASPAETQKSQALLEAKYSTLEWQKTSAGFIVKSTDLNKQQAEKITRLLNRKTKAKKTRFEVVGPSVSQGNIRKIVLAAAIALLGILLYVAISFKDWRFGLAAIIALLHDTLVLAGCWSVLGYFWKVEFDVLFVTSLLTTMSFSVHDTIVIFDKIQEEERQVSFSELGQRINWALSLTMMRSLNNSLTVVLMLSSLIILGGETTRWFAASLLVGTITGTYSSPFVATPIYYLLTRRK